MLPGMNDFDEAFMSSIFLRKIVSDSGGGLGSESAGDLQVLFIGNSQIFFNDLPRMLEALADSAPAERPRIRAARFVAGGASLESLWNAGNGKGTARAKIREKKWDYVILQDIYLVKPDSFNKYAPLFHALNRENGSQTMLFCTAGVSSQYPKEIQELHGMHIAQREPGAAY